MKGTKDLKGSPARDAFKHAHKARMSGSNYACDLDLVLVEKNPPGIVAFLDYKRPSDTVTFSEVIAYNAALAIARVYIVEAASEDGPFKLYQYKGGDWKPDPPQADLRLLGVCPDWATLETWERKLRADYKKRCAQSGSGTQ